MTVNPRGPFASSEDCAGLDLLDAPSRDFVRPLCSVFCRYPSELDREYALDEAALLEVGPPWLTFLVS